jgi:hypothetical protein
LSTRNSTWFNAQGDRHLSAVEQETKAREKAKHQAAQLKDYLRSQDIGPNRLPE